MPASIPFSLPEEIVAAGRKARESSALDTITSELDRTVKSGMSGLEHAAGVVAEPFKPLAAALGTGLSVPSLDDLTPDWIKDQQRQASQLTQQASSFAQSAASGITVPTLDDLTPDWMRPAPAAATASPPAATTGAPAGRLGPSLTSGPPPSTGAPSGTGTTPNEYLRSAALAKGIDPGQVLAVMGKEGPTGWGSVGTFDTGTSYGPLQLHYAGGSNPKQGMGDRFTAATGIDLRKDSSLSAHQRAVDFALDELAKRGDWSEWYGADNAFPASAGGKGRFTPVGRVAPVASAVPAAAAAAPSPRQPALTSGPVPQGPRQAGLDVSGITQVYAGQPYVFGGAGGRGDMRPGVATDCSGFVASVWKNQYGLDLPAHTDGAYNALKQQGAPEVSQADARPGDVVFYMGAGTGGAITHHMGIYAGPGKVLDMSVSGGDGVKVRDLGHGGQFVIMRDPRVNQEAPRTAQAPPPIVPTGVAERTGGEPLSQAQTNALSRRGGDDRLAMAPGLMSDTSFGMGTQATPAASAPAPPVRDDYRTEAPVPFDPDQGPHEQPYPGTVTPIQNPDGSLTTERSITVTEPDLNGGAATNIPTVWSGRVVDDDTAITNAINARRAFPSYPTIDAAVTAAEQRSQDLGSGATSVGGAQPFAAPPEPTPAPSWGQSLLDAGSSAISAATDAAGRAISTVQGAYAVPVEQRPPQYSGPSYAQPRQDEPPAPAPPGFVQAAAAPAQRVYGQAIEEANAAQDELDERTQPKMSELGRAINVPWSTMNRGLRIANSVIMATPQATADTIDLALQQAGLGRATIGLDVPIVGRVGIADLVDLPGPAGAVTNLGLGRASVLRAAPTRAGQAIAAQIPNVAAPVERAAGAIVQAGTEAAGRAFRGMAEPIAGIRGAVAGNAERMAAADARMAQEGSTAAPATLGITSEHVYSPEPPPGTARRYHGTAGAFDAADPAKFDENGLYGPGYYTTSDPRVASSYGVQQAKHAEFLADEIADAERQLAYHGEQMAKPPEQRMVRSPGYYEGKVAEQEARIADLRASMPNAGPNVRAVDIPPDVKLLDADAPLTQDVLDRVNGVIDQMAKARPDVAAEFRDEVQRLEDLLAQRARSSDPIATPTDFLLQRMFGAADRVSPAIKDGSYGAKGLATEILERAGFDGIAHTGGQRVPMLDADGKPIEHDVSVIFPGSINKVRNALSGTYGGATLGVLPPSVGRPDRLAGVNRVLSQGAVSGVSGTTTGLVNQEMNPDDPYAFGKGFVAGAVGPPLLARGARRLARAAGRGVDVGGGARIGLGDVPPSRLREPTLPGMEPSAPRPIGEVAQDLALSPEQRTGLAPIPDARDLPAGSSLQQALPDILRGLNPTRSAREAAQADAALPTLGAPSGPVRRLASAVSDLVAPWVGRANVVRYAGMLSDAAGHVFNATGNALLQGVDLATAPIAAGLDVGRTALARTGLPYVRDLGTDRQVWLSEVGPRVTGMRTGAKVGLQAAADVLATGVTPGEAGKLDVARAGWGTNIPGVAPAGSAGANVVDFAMEAPLRAMAAADAAFRTSAQGGHLMAEAYAAARKANGGRPPTTPMIREAAKQPDVVERALELAKRSVLQEDRAVTQAYQDFLKKTGVVGDMVSLEVPFVKTPYNVVAQGMGMTPAGLAQTALDIKAGKSARHVEQQLARVMLGTAVMGVAFSDYSMGNLTGPYPTDEKTASTLPPGWRPWSRKFEVGGETFYLPLAVLGPLALPAVVAILAGESVKAGKGPLTAEGAGAIARGVGAYAVQSSFFGGLSELGKLFDLRTGDPDFERQAERLVSQFSPHILGGGGLGRSIQRMLGMPARDPEGAGEAMLATFPYQDQAAGLLGRSAVAPAQDVLGRPRSQGASGPIAAIIRAGQEDDASVIRAYRQSGRGLPTAAPKEIPDPTTGAMRELSPPQRHQWRSVFGTELQIGWANAGAPSDPKRLDAIEAKARENAARTVLGLR